MKRYTYETVVPIAPDKLYRALIDVASWPAWDSDIESIDAPEPIAAGARFTLKPKGAPAVAMTVEAAEPFRRFVDVSHLALAKMRTAHEMEVVAGGTRLRLVIEITGLLAFLWDRVVARKQAAGAATQTQSLVRYAEAAS
jgi:polyketide cyclase/dehydrase/lipid transport protein